MPTGRRGFTLIELLVVIAIIGILAAMLFPVFARARESARKVQCLSNVKNIALAMNMYLTDYDKFPPSEHRAEVIWYFGGGGPLGCDQHKDHANPYLRWPVILDEYTKNRDIWRCPSAKFTSSLGIAPVIPDWFRVIEDTGPWGPAQCYGLVCWSSYPPGWGGTITDSVAQQTCATSDRNSSVASGGAFVMNYSYNDSLMDKSTSVAGDAASCLIVVDGGAKETLEIRPGFGFGDASRAAYPDLCRLRCDSVGCPWGPGADWENCSWTQECGAGDTIIVTDLQYRKQHFPARHLGGINIGFADGHAKWMNSESFLASVPDMRSYKNEAERPKSPTINNMGLCGMITDPDKFNW